MEIVNLIERTKNNRKELEISKLHRKSLLNITIMSAVILTTIIILSILIFHIIVNHNEN